jgi:hypothetical protein
VCPRRGGGLLASSRGWRSEATWQSVSGLVAKPGGGALAAGRDRLPTQGLTRSWMPWRVPRRDSLSSWSACGCFECASSAAWAPLPQLTVGKGDTTPLRADFKARHRRAANQRHGSAEKRRWSRSTCRLTVTGRAGLVSAADAELRPRFDCGEARFRAGEAVSTLGSAGARRLCR